MSAHDYHEGLPRYDPDAVMLDGCGECEYRAGLPVWMQVNHLDPARFGQAWRRSIQWKHQHLPVQQVEVELLEALYAIRSKLHCAEGVAEFVARGAL